MENINWQRIRDVLISIIGICILLWILSIVLGQFIEVIIILLLSMAVAFLLTPAVDLLMKFHIPRVLAVVLVYIIVIAAIGGLGYGLVTTLIDQVRGFSNVIQNFALDLPNLLPNIIEYLEKQQHIPDSNIQAALSQIRDSAVEFAKTMAVNAPNFILLVTGAFLNILLVGVLSFYLTVDGKRIRDGLISIVPKKSLPNVLLFEDALNRVVGNYIRGQLTLAVIIGLITSLVCIFTGLKDYALLCGVLAFLFETIPMVGPGLASITPILLSLLIPGDVFQRTLIIIICFIGIQIVESNWLGPRIVGHAVGLHPVAAILALLAGAKVFGVFGALLATPVVAAAWVVLASIYRSARGETMPTKRRASWPLRTGMGRNKRPPVNGSHETPTDTPPRTFIAITDSEHSRQKIQPDEPASK